MIGKNVVHNNIPTPITLSTLQTATAQQVFVYVANHLLTQNKKSMTHIHGVRGYGPVCAYHGSNGTSCAAGCLIADDEYESTFEQNTWTQLSDHNRVPSVHAVLIRNLQMIHDGYDVDQWKIQLKMFAKIYSFDWKIIDQPRSWLSRFIAYFITSVRY